MKARISIVIPVYNGEKYLAEALRSALDQSLPPDEIWTVDDGSTDRSAELAAAFGPPVRLLRQERRGPGAARNLGIQASQGDLLAFLDADDRWAAEKLEIQVEAFRKDPGLDMVFGQVRQFLSPDLSPAEREGLFCPEEDASGYVLGAMLVKKKSFLKAGRLAENVKIGEFIDWYARAKGLGFRESLLPRVLLHRRIHRDNTTRRERGSRSDYLRILKASLDRRRASGHD